jgi:hypothetical protein
MDFRYLLDNNILSSQEKLNIINNCTCCEIHQQKRPRFYSPWVDTNSTRGQFLKHPFNPSSCPCNCRQTARFICRAPKILDSVDYDSESSGRSTPFSECTEID